VRRVLGQPPLQGGPRDAESSCGLTVGQSSTLADVSCILICSFPQQKPMKGCGRCAKPRSGSGTVLQAPVAAFCASTGASPSTPSRWRSRGLRQVATTSPLALDRSSRS
jgi:hypothetical protein